MGDSALSPSCHARPSSQCHLRPADEATTTQQRNQPGPRYMYMIWLFSELHRLIHHVNKNAPPQEHSRQQPPTNSQDATTLDIADTMSINYEKEPIGIENNNYMKCFPRPDTTCHSNRKVHLGTPTPTKDASRTHARAHARKQISLASHNMQGDLTTPTTHD